MLEGIAFMYLLAYFKVNKLLGPLQFCYKKGQNNQNVLLNVIEDSKLAIEKRKITIL